MGNTSTIEVGSNIPSNTILGTMTRFESKTITTTTQKQYERIILGTPARQIPFQFKSTLIDTTISYNKSHTSKLNKILLILSKYC
ncbi:unnamed protein product [Didymodactylos carnosus]|nr:unnamed protein product [Didymodactylos carnosus]CAF4519231.1 unnamed protein product [Didymodactylos carnosus]